MDFFSSLPGNRMSDPRAAAKAKLIFALDVPSAGKARHLVTLLKDHVGLFKVGLELFVSAGPAVLDAISDQTDAGIFLDLKFHDIPETMRAAQRAAEQHRVRFVTVHCDQRTRLSTRPATTRDPQLLGVTVLTSLSQADLQAAGWYAPDLTVEKLALLRAETAVLAGCAGVVCSGNEARQIKTRFGPDFLVITPGIRPAWAPVDKDDQQRATTPAEAIAQGADYLVVGRPIRTAPDPVKAAERVIDEIAASLATTDR
jgi:orotidine-5'-phosphate decarboxylase